MSEFLHNGSLDGELEVETTSVKGAELNDQAIDHIARIDEVLNSLLNESRIISDFGLALSSKRQEQSLVISKGFPLTDLPTNRKNFLLFASTIKNNNSISNVVNIGKRYGVSVDGVGNNPDGSDNIFKRADDMALSWVYSQRSNKGFLSELGKLLECSSYKEMTIKVELINTNILPKELINLPIMNMPDGEVDLIKRYVVFRKKTIIHRKKSAEKMLFFSDRINEFDRCEAILDAYQVNMSESRHQQDTEIAKGNKLMPLELNRQNLLLFASTIIYNDAIWTIQSLGVDSGMQVVGGIKRRDFDILIASINNTVASSMRWLRDHYDNIPLMVELDKLLCSTKYSDIEQAVENADLSVFPEYLPNTPILRPVRFTIKK